MIEKDHVRLALIGRRVELVHTDDEFTTLKPGDRGVVHHIDDAGTIFLSWDNGSTLGLIPGIDEFTFLRDAYKIEGR